MDYLKKYLKYKKKYLSIKKKQLEIKKKQLGGEQNKKKKINYTSIIYDLLNKTDIYNIHEIIINYFYNISALYTLDFMENKELTKDTGEVTPVIEDEFDCKSAY